MWSYFQWFLLGFYKLDKKKDIKLRIDLPIAQKACFWFVSDFANRAAKRLSLACGKKSYCMDGYLEENGRKIKFTIDCADAPYLFDYERLKQVDVYFKMQYPTCIDEEDFTLCKDVHIPWCNSGVQGTKTVENHGIIYDFSEYKHKVLPLMIGPRRLATGNNYTLLNDSYERYVKGYKEKKEKKVMCYFGNAKGPELKDGITEQNVDYSSESDVNSLFRDRISHPNEKREIISDYLESLGDDYDARLISRGNADSLSEKNEKLVIPLKDFCDHISLFEYNVNVSGYHLSIPNRFIESFIVGTAIITDKLKVKWYLPFDEAEVFETVEMGYAKEEDVDWDQFYRDIKSLSRTSPSEIKKCFERKWSPEAVANYIIKALEQKR